MAPDETDTSPEENGHQRSGGDRVDWSDIDPYRGRIPPGHDSEWTIASISRRFKHGQHAGDAVDSPTGEPVRLGDPHWYVTIRRDQFPDTRGVTSQYNHYVFPDTDALAA